MRSILLTSALAALASFAAAGEIPDPVAEVEVLPGWRDADGRHTGAIRITLAPGWKTYWRAPGDAGIPPAFDWSGSRNVTSVEPGWPAPEVFWQNGMRSLGYGGEVIIPLSITPSASGEAMRLEGRIEIGVCEDVCIPISLPLSGELPMGGSPDARISAARAAEPMPAAQAGVGRVTCAVEPIADGLRVSAAIEMPPLGGSEIAVLELADPSIWISEATMRRSGGVLEAVAEMVPPNGQPFALDRSQVRITVLAGDSAVDIQGCTGG